MQTQSQAYLYGLGAVFLWSTVATAFKLSLNYLSSAQLLLLACTVSCLVLGIILGIQGRFRQIRQLSPGDYLSSVLFGALNPMIYYLVLFRAYELLPAQEAQAINYTWALTMTLLAVPLLGHRLSARDIIAALFCYFGVLVLATKGDVSGLNFTNLSGVGLALFSTVLWALYWILNTRDKRDPVAGLFMNFVCALPLILLYCAITGELSWMPWQGVLGALYVGVFEMGLTFVLWLSAMKLTESTAKISNLIFIAPFLSLFFISMFLGEAILPSTLYGLFFIITGLVLQQLRFASKAD
jgi:drug/metabolite transporter (DMT)-like permease